MGGPWEKYAAQTEGAAPADAAAKPWEKYAAPAAEAPAAPAEPKSFLERLRAGGTELPPEAAAMRPTAAPTPAPEDRAGVHEKLDTLGGRLKAGGADPRQSPQYRELAKEQAAGVAQNDREAATLIAPFERGLAGMRGPDLGRAANAVAAPFKKAVQWLFDIDPEKAAQAAALGKPVAPSGYMNAPRLQRNVDLAKVFQADPMKKGAEETVQAGVQEALEKSGFAPEAATAERERLAKVERPDPAPAGEAVKAAAGKDAVKAQTTLKDKITGVRHQAQKRGLREQAALYEEQQTARAELARVETEINKELDAGWKKVEAIRQVRDPKLLAEAMAGTVQSLRQKVMEHAETRYALADKFAGGEQISVRGAQIAAKDFLELLPEDLRRNMPALLKSLDEMETGRMSFGQLHYLRSQLRDLGYLDAEKLTPSFKRGPYKALAGVVDHIIHDQKDNPALALAAKALDSADAYYAKEMKRFKDATIQGFVDNLKAGLPPDPHAVARQVVQAGADNSKRLAEILRIAGPKVAEKIRSADYDDLLANSRHPLSGEIDAKALLGEVEARRKNGTLAQLWGKKEAETIETEVRRLAASAGDVPIEHLPPDQFAAALKRGNALGDQLKALAKQDPVAMMENALKEGQKQAKALTAGFKEAQRQDALTPLASPRLMASHAAEQLLETANTPMLETAILRWGENSEAVQRLRLFAIEKTLAPVMRGEDPAQLIRTFGGMTRKQQELLFPQGMAGDLVKMVDELKLMYGNPTRSVPGFAAGEALDLPLRQGAVRQYYRISMAYAVTHPKFVRAMAAMVKAGGPYREQARGEMRALVARLYFATYASENGWQEEPPQPPAAPPRSWREQAAQPRGLKNAAPTPVKRPAASAIKQRAVGEPMERSFLDKLLGHNKTEAAGAFPSSEDAAYADKQGFGYGRDTAGYTKAVDATGLRGATSDVAKRIADLKPKDNPQAAEVFTRAGLAANRSAIAALGFAPGKTALENSDEKLTVGGFFSPSKDVIMARSSDPSTVVHESVHRGLEQLRTSGTLDAKEKRFLDKWEETVVRHIMYQTMGDPEGGAGKIDAEERASGKHLYEVVPDAKALLSSIEEKAAQEVARRRPRGPN